VVFFGKARCNSCHAGDNYTDNQFHNLGVGVTDGQLPANALGRYGAQPLGAKDPALAGAFKTPTLRHLLGTAPYMHNGSEATLDKVVDFYDKGGNANEFLDPKMRDYDAEKAYLVSAADKTEYKGPQPQLFGKGKTPVIPLKLNLSAQEKQDLVLFLRSLQGDPADPIIADPEKLAALK
jgi:cytochrome c peroxidase